jgi:hypothetical protein
MAHLQQKARIMIVEEWQRVQSITTTSNELKVMKGTRKLWIGRPLATGSEVDKVGKGRQQFFFDGL